MTHPILMRAVLAHALATISVPALAGGIPVIDTASIARLALEYSELIEQGAVMDTQVGQLAEQLQQGSERFQQLTEQIEQLDTQIAAMTGGRDLAGILDGSVESALRDLAPSALSTITEGGGSAEVAERFAAMMDAFAPRSAEELRPHDPGAPAVLATREASEQVYAALALAQAEMAAGEDYEQQYRTLIEAIDDTDDVKASIDLSARIAAQNGLMTERLTRIIAAQIQAQTAQDRRDIMRSEERIEYRDDLVSGMIGSNNPDDDDGN